MVPFTGFRLRPGGRGLAAFQFGCVIGLLQNGATAKDLAARLDVITVHTIGLSPNATRSSAKHLHFLRCGKSRFGHELEAARARHGVLPMRAMEGDM
jgi:hypothetical protein